MLSKFRKFIVFIRNSKTVALLSLDILAFFILRLFCVYYFITMLCCSCALTECGSVINNRLKSPGYPKKYPGNMDCAYSVSMLPPLKIIFEVFDVEETSNCE